MKKALLYLSPLLAPALVLLLSYFNLSKTERYYCCLLTTLLAVQLFMSLLLKYNKLLNITVYKTALEKAANILSYNHFTGSLAAFILSTFTCSTYLMVCLKITPLSILLIPIFLITYYISILVNKFQKAYLTGYKALFYHLHTSISIIIGIIIFLFLSEILGLEEDKYDRFNFDSQCITFLLYYKDYLLFFAILIVPSYIIHWLVLFIAFVKERCSVTINQ